jgi:hypothetical protein
MNSEMSFRVPWKQEFLSEAEKLWNFQEWLHHEASLLLTEKPPARNANWLWYRKTADWHSGKSLFLTAFVTDREQFGPFRKDKLQGS